MLATTIALHDIDDVEAFVVNSLYRSGIDFESANEREELVGEGICILYELERQFEPHRPGYSQAGRFSGYAAQFLPRRLGDAWHKRHPNHRRVAGEDGKRQWVYQEAPLSLDQVLASQSLTAKAEGGESLSRQARAEAFRPPNQWAPTPVPSSQKPPVEPDR